MLITALDEVAGTGSSMCKMGHLYLWGTLWLGSFDPSVSLCACVSMCMCVWLQLQLRFFSVRICVMCVCLCALLSVC